MFPRPLNHACASSQKLLPPDGRTHLPQPCSVPLQKQFPVPQTEAVPHFGHSSAKQALEAHARLPTHPNSESLLIEIAHHPKYDM